VQVLWFFVGLFVGLVLDFFLVVHMLRPFGERLASLENQNLCAHMEIARLTGELKQEHN